MPSNPTLSSIHVDVPLSNVSQAIIQQEKNFVAGQVFPNVPSAFASNKYYVYTQADFFRSDAILRMPGSEAPAATFSLSTSSYYCQDYAVRMDIDDMQRANADPAVDLERGAVTRVTMDLLIKRENDWATSFFKTSVWQNDTTPSVLWDNVNSTPIEDVRARKLVIAQNTGYQANTLVLGPNVYMKLVDHPDIIDRVKYTQRGVITPDILAAVFDVERVLILWATNTSSADGAASPTYSFIAGKNALLCYTPSAPGLMVPAAGYTFTWSDFGTPNGPTIFRYRREPIRSDTVEAHWAFDAKVIGKPLGEFFSAVVP